VRPLGPGPGATVSERAEWWYQHDRAQQRAQRDWRRIRLDQQLARAVKVMVVFSGRARAQDVDLIPPSEPGDTGWTVVVSVRPAAGGPDLLIALTTLGDAAPFLRGVATKRGPKPVGLDPAAMADTWGALERSTRPVGGRTSRREAAK
jgi:hypothetical protein